MSKKVLGIGLAIVGAALMFTGVGAPLGTIALGAGLGSISVATVVGMGLMVASNFLMGPAKPKALRTSPSDRLTATLDPTSPRKIVFGNTAMATDVRYQAFTGTKQEYLEQIVCVASHKVQSIDELWLDNEKAWTAAGGAQGRFVGFLTVNAVLEGTSANGITIDSVWTASCTLTGCAYLRLKFLLVHDDGKGGNDSPFASGVSSRMTIRGKGAFVYDPRLDSTVAGGSGTQRADDQTTWAWNDNASRNPALQELFYELGWKIGGKLAVGKGLPKARLDLPSFQIGANTCDESIALNGGGTEARYRSDGVLSESDDPGAVRDNLCATMNAVLRDAGGKLALTVLHNDLATPVSPSGRTAFDERDIMGEIQFDQTPDLAQSFNIVRGTRIDPSDQALYNLVDFPEVKITSPDGIDRIDTVAYPMVQSNGQAQRLAKQRLQRNQYQGRISFTGKPSFWGMSLGDVFPLTLAAFGWNAKLFRCAGQKINRWGATEIVAVEENAAIYAWDNNEAAAVSPGTPTVYDPAGNHPMQRGINQSAKTGVVIDPVADVIIYADSSGTVKTGELPRDVGITASIGLSSITSAGSWSRTAVTGVTCTIGAGTGILNITALTVNEATIPVTFTYNGITRSVNVHIIRQDDPPTTGGTGGTGGTSASTTSLGVTSTNNATGATASAIMQVKAGSGGQITCSAPLFFKRTPGTAAGVTGAQGKWQWRVVGGTFADIAAAGSDSWDAQTIVNAGDPTQNQSGSISVTQTKLGLTNGTTYEVQFVWWRVDVSGTSNNVYRNSGTLTATGS
jgi:hypothetical protein